MKLKDLLRDEYCFLLFPDCSPRCITFRLIGAQIGEVYALIGQSSDAEPAAIENALPTLEDVELFGGRLSLNLVGQSVEAPLVLQRHRSSHILASVHSKTTE